MQQVIFFLGRLHVLALHLPLGILLLATGMELVVRIRRHRGGSSLEPAMPLVWGVGALSAVVTVALGYMHAREPGFSGPLVSHHRWAGTALAFTATLIWAWRGDASRSFGFFWPSGLTALTALMLVTGHLGGTLTHGPGYLTTFAPATRPKVVDAAAADVYRDLVGPIFTHKCASCHNTDKRRGGLSLLDYASACKGGESGPVIKPGDPKGSELYRRITLTPDDQDYMPQNHRNPPTQAEITALAWWITVGAPAQGKIMSLSPPAAVSASINEILGR